MSIVPLNFEIMRNPWNWVTFTIMFLIAAYAFAVLLPEHHS